MTVYLVIIDYGPNAGSRYVHAVYVSQSTAEEVAAQMQAGVYSHAEVYVETHDVI